MKRLGTKLIRTLPNYFWTLVSPAALICFGQALPASAQTPKASFSIQTTATCPAGKIIAGPSGKQKSYSTFREALKDAKSGWVIDAGSGSWQEVLSVKHATNLVIKTSCKASILGVRIAKSSHVTIDGFVITPWDVARPRR